MPRDPCEGRAASGVQLFLRSSLSGRARRPGQEGLRQSAAHDGARLDSPPTGQGFISALLLRMLVRLPLCSIDVSNQGVYAREVTDALPPPSTTSWAHPPSFARCGPCQQTHW